MYLSSLKMLISMSRYQLPTLCWRPETQKQSSMLQWKIRGAGNKTNQKKCNTKQTVDKCSRESTKCLIISKEDVSSCKKGRLERPDDLWGREVPSGAARCFQTAGRKGRQRDRIVSEGVRSHDSPVSLLPSSRRKPGSALGSWRMSCAD